MSGKREASRWSLWTLWCENTIIAGVARLGFPLSNGNVPMTLQKYGPEKLDEMALRVLDLAGIIRQMANESREQDIAELPLHDKKALLWLGNLETWAHKGHRDLDIRIHEAKAARRAKSLG